MFTVGLIAFLVGTIGISTIILRTFGGGDRVIPMVFVIGESVIALLAFRRISGTFAPELAAAVAGEREMVTYLARSSATVGDALLLARQHRTDRTHAFHDNASGWSNLLVMAGMIGTAFYLVLHAGEFMIANRSDLTTALTELLALAPKAFAATGLALWGAAAVSASSGRFVHQLESLAPEPDELARAWSEGYQVVAGENVSQLASAMSAALDDRVVRRLELLPDRLAAVAENSHSSVEQMRQAVSELVKNIDTIGTELKNVATGARTYFDEAVQVAKTLQNISGESEKIFARLSQTEERIGSTAGASIEKMQGVLETYQARLVQEVSRSAPDVVRSALSTATDEFTQRIRAQGTAIETTIHTLANASFGEAERRFIDAIQSTSGAVGTLQQRVEQVDAVLSKLGGLLEVAGTTWSPHVETTRMSLDQLSQALVRLGNASGTSPTNLTQVCEEMDRASRKLSSSIQVVVAQSAALGEISGILQSEHS